MNPDPSEHWARLLRLTLGLAAKVNLVEPLFSLFHEDSFPQGEESRGFGEGLPI